MDRNKLLQIKLLSNNIINIIDDILLITKNKGIKKNITNIYEKD